MNDSQALQVLAGHYGPGDTVYTSARAKRRGFFLELLDMIVSTGVIGSISDIADNTGARYFLIASPAAATVVRVDGQAIDRVIPILNWDGARLNNFRKVTAEGYDYLKGAKIA